MTFAVLSSTAAAESYGFRTKKALTLPALAPYDNKYTNIQWNTEPSESIGVPVVYEESVLVPSGDTLLRLNEADGTKMAEIKLPQKANTVYSGIMAGNTLIQPLEKGICTVDFTTGEITSYKELDGAIDSDCAVIEQLAYFSVKSNGSETMICADLSDGLSTVWEHTAKADITSPALQGEHVIFGAGSTLVTHHFKDESFCEIPVDNEIISAPFASQYAVFFTDNAGNACKLRLNTDGSMEEDTFVKCAVGASPSAPVAWNSKLYVASETGFHILDSINMEISYTLESFKDGSDPFICYGNGTRVYSVGENEGRYELHSIFDEGEDNPPTDKILAIMENYENGRSAVSSGGTLYFRDGIGRIYALTRVEYDIVSIVIKLLIMLALIAGVFIWIRMIGKRRAANNPRY
ncbi:MAG: hypothetical protein IJO91_09830 [Oscillospiraceae bacterium]|nr:hypothetical protein [Oscillospiraceae bacterium]